MQPPLTEHGAIDISPAPCKQVLLYMSCTPRHSIQGSLRDVAPLNFRGCHMLKRGNRCSYTSCIYDPPAQCCVRLRIPTPPVITYWALNNLPRDCFSIYMYSIQSITGVVYCRKYNITGVITVNENEFRCHHPIRYLFLWHARTPLGTACLLT